MLRRPPRSTRTDTLFPYTTLFRSLTIRDLIMSFINIAKDVLRPLRDVVSAGYGFLYDYARFYRYAGWRRMDRWSVRDYKAVKIYHRLEKRDRKSTRLNSSH